MRAISTALALLILLATVNRLRAQNNSQPTRGEEIGHFRFDDTNPPSRIRNPATGEESDPVVIPNPRNKAHAAINLWLVKGQPPANTADVEIVVSNFRFVPRPE